MKKKTALITGICGQDGSYLAEFLLNKGYYVVGLVRRNATRNLENATHLQNDVDLEEGDITDMSSMLRIIQKSRPHEIYNLAAMSHVHTSFEQPIATFEIDTIGLVNILEVIKTLGFTTRIFQASTSELWGSSPPPQNEETIMRPKSPYAISKLASHWMVNLYREAYGMFACCGITHNHECFHRHTPVIIKKENTIDIVYVDSLAPTITENNNFKIRDWQNENIDIWDGNNFVKLKAVSHKQAKYLSECDKKITTIYSNSGFIKLTPNHKIFSKENEKFELRNLKCNNYLLNGCEPILNNIVSYIPKNVCIILGMICKNGIIDDDTIYLSTKDENVKVKFEDLGKKVFPKSCIFENNTFKKFPKNIIQWIKNLIFDLKSYHKKVPSEILNSTYECKKSFLDGFLYGESNEIKLENLLIAQGILLLLKNVCPGNNISINVKNNNFSFENSKVLILQDKVLNDNKFVYNIETESEKVMAGFGTLIVGNSERRGPMFVTRKISMGVAECLKDPKFRLKLGNLNSSRDWGYAKDYVEAFWLMLQQEKPKDYVIATGEMHTVKEFVETAFNHVGLNWEEFVEIDRFLKRPAEVEALCGNYDKIKNELQWEPKVKFNELVKIMVDYDCLRLGVKK